MRERSDPDALRARINALSSRVAEIDAELSRLSVFDQETGPDLVFELLVKFVYNFTPTRNLKTPVTR